MNSGEQVLWEALVQGVVRETVGAAALLQEQR